MDLDGAALAEADPVAGMIGSPSQRNSFVCDPSQPDAPLGYSNVAPGHIVNVVTCLEMLERPASLSDTPFPDGITLEAPRRSDLAAYRALFRKIGVDWLWSSRLVMSDEKLNVL